MASSKKAQSLRDAIWNGSLPLEIRLSPAECRVYDQADPYLIQHPRLSYLPFLLPRLHAFFHSFLINPDLPSHEGWFSFEEIPLKWHYPLGLLYDLFSGAAPSQSPGPDPENHGTPEAKYGPLPWRLTLHFTEWPDEQLVRLDGGGKVLHDAFINSVKEADFLRNGTAKGIMSLSLDDSTRLWTAVQDQNLGDFSSIYQKLLYAQGAPLRHIPLKIYLPTSPATSSPTGIGHLRVVQSLVTPTVPGTREPQTLGSALYLLLPALFPSRRTPILAKPVLHGAVVPMGASVEELLRDAAYLDGWLHLGVMMMG
ncbi:autophagy protein 5 [Lobaria immixta]|nr:autophagy protein 5 [Lobaria immixta]